MSLTNFFNFRYYYQIIFTPATMHRSTSPQPQTAPPWFEPFIIIIIIVPKLLEKKKQQALSCHNYIVHGTQPTSGMRLPSGVPRNQQQHQAMRARPTFRGLVNSFFQFSIICCVWLDACDGRAKRSGAEWF